MAEGHSKSSSDKKAPDKKTPPQGQAASPPAKSVSAASGKIDSKMDNAELEQHWQRVRARLRGELGDATFNSWFKLLRLGALKKTTLVLEAPTSFISSWIEDNYAGRLLVLWKQACPAIARVQLAVVAHNWEPAEEPAAPRQVPVAASRFTGFAGAPPRKAPARRADMDTLSAPLDARFTFDNFVVGKSNEMAYTAARRLCESDEVSFNPLFLYGGVGLGKTHLMHAIAWELRANRSDKRVLYLSAEQFMYQFIRALRIKNTMAFKEQFRGVDVLMVDDIQFISGKNTTQEEFFHTFNALIDHKHQIIISADCSPSDLDGIEERIRSRLGWGLVADIHPTDYELRLGILQAKLEQIMAQSQFGQTNDAPKDVPRDVLEFLAQRITANIRELEGALNRIMVYASFVGKPVSLDMARDVLSDLLRAHERRATIEDIQRRVAEYYNVPLTDMLSERRAREIARPRQVAMYLSKQLTRRSLPDIGRKFGGRDHTTVIHAIKRIDNLRADDKALDEDVDVLRRMLGH